MNTHICDIEHYAVHDGPGIRTLVFFKGCPLRCRWCANPETQAFTSEYFFSKEKCIGCGRCQNNPAFTCPVEAKLPVSKLMTVQEVLKEILDDQPFYRTSGGGVTLSGGEVLMHKDFAVQLLTVCKEHYVNTAIETCGFADFSTLAQIAALCDTILYDIKLYDPDKHKYWTGVSNDLIVSNLHSLAKIHSDIIIRLPLIPTVNNNDEEISAICSLMNECNLNELHILPYHSLAKDKYRRLEREYPMPDFPAISADEIQHCKNLTKSYKINCRVSG